MIQRSWLFCLGLLAAIALALPPVSAQAADRAGYIVNTQGGSQKVTVKRSDRTLRAKTGMFLYGGDTIRVSGSGNYVTVKFGGSGGRKKITSAQSPFTIPRPSESGIGAYWSRIWSNLGAALGVTDRRTSSGTYARGAPAEGGTAEPLSGLAAFDAPILYAASELDTLAIRWCGDAQGAQIGIGSIASPNAQYGGQEFGSVEIRDYRFPADYGSRLPSEIMLEAAASGSESLEYKLKWVSLDSVPRPDALAGKAELSVEDKAVWGHWILSNENNELGPAYNLIAFSLLNEAKDDFWVAAYEMERFSYCPEWVAPPVLSSPEESSPAD